MASRSSTYFLTRHAHVLVTNDAAIILDLRADKYHGITHEQAVTLSRVVKGWPSASPDSGGTADSSPQDGLVEELLEMQILTADASIGKPVEPLSIPVAQERLYEWDRRTLSKFRLSFIARMGSAYARARLFRKRSLYSCVSSMASRKHRRRASACNDIEQARELTKIFWTVRPLFYTARDQCLLDSMVLVEFLAMFDVFPTWIIGVKANPFAAHCWVQIDDYVLNGPPGFVQSFRPILAV